MNPPEKISNKKKLVFFLNQIYKNSIIFRGRLYFVNGPEDLGSITGRVKPKTKDFVNQYFRKHTPHWS